MVIKDENSMCELKEVTQEILINGICFKLLFVVPYDKSLNDFTSYVVSGNNFMVYDDLNSFVSSAKSSNYVRPQLICYKKID